MSWGVRHPQRSIPRLSCYTMDGGRRKHSRTAIRKRRLKPQYFAAEKNSISCMFVTLWTHPIFCVDMSHKLCDGTNEMTLFKRRRNQLTLRINDDALALIERAGRRSPAEAASLVELETRIEELRISLAAEQQLGRHLRKLVAAHSRLNRRRQTSRR